MGKERPTEEKGVLVSNCFGQSRGERLVAWCSCHKNSTRVLPIVVVLTIGVMVSGPPADDEKLQTVAGPGEVQDGQKSLAFGSYEGDDDRQASRTPPPTKAAREVTASKKPTGPKLFRRPRELQFPPGTLARAQLATGASTGPVKAVLTEAVVVGGETLLEAGVSLLGSGQSGEERLSVHFERALFPDGTLADVNAIALDPSDQIPGLKGSRVGHYGAKLAGSIGLNFLSGMSEGLEQTQAVGPVTLTAPTMRNALLRGASRTALEESQNMMGSLKNTLPLIEVAAGSAVLIMMGAKP